MCLLVQPSLLTVIIVVHDHSINIAVRHPSAEHGRKKLKGVGGGEESIRMGQDMSFCGFYSCN